MLKQRGGSICISRTTRGVCGNHTEGRTLAHCAHSQGYYWPTTKQDSQEYVKQCDRCQRHAPIPRMLSEVLNLVTSKEENIAEIRRYFGEISVCRWVPTRHTAEKYRRSTLGQHRRSTVKMKLFSSCCWGDSNPQQKISTSGPVPLGQTCPLINITH